MSLNQVENCNVTSSKRLELLDCAFKPKDACCVYFDVGVDVCKRRAAIRSGHQTKKLFDSSRGFRIIDSFAKQLEIPQTKEGFKQVITVRNNEDIDQVLFRLGVRKSIESGFSDEIQPENDGDGGEEKKERNEIDHNIDNKSAELSITARRRNRDIRMARSCSAMSIEVLCKKLNLEMDDVLNVAVLGSRVWGTATDESDWNVIIVTESEGHKSRQSVDNIDAYIFSKTEWNSEMKKYRFMCWITLFLPQDALWREEYTISHIEEVDGFKLKDFVNALKRDLDRDCKKMKIFHGKKRKGKVQRTFMHCLRMMWIAKQIIILMQGMSPGDDEIDVTQHSFVGAIRFHEISKRVTAKKEQIVDVGSDSISKWTEPLQMHYKQCLDMMRMDFDYKNDGHLGNIADVGDALEVDPVMIVIDGSIMEGGGIHSTHSDIVSSEFWNKHYKQDKF